MNTKSFYIKTYGCQMNVYDSEAMEGLLMDHGFSPAASEPEADIILLNTCSVRDLAEQKAIGKTGILGKLKRTNPDLVLGICGCMAQNMKETLFKKIPTLDLVCGPNDLLSLPKLIRQALEGKRQLLQVENPNWVMTADIPKRRKTSISAWISVMRGCNHNCTFCIVPTVRGREVSRPVEDLLKEVHALVQDGYKEVTLLGQNINSYGRDLRNGSNFSKLLDKLNEIHGLDRIRFTTSHPVDIRDELITTMSRLGKVCEFLHFPIQSGSNRILSAMKRGYTREQYLEKVEKVRSRIPKIALSTDIIVGFPGETDEDFQETCKVLEDAQFDGAFLFKYSVRSGTPAATLPDQVPEKIKEERHNIIFKLQDKISAHKNNQCVGKALEVLVEGHDRKGRNLLYGRSRKNQMIYFEGENELIGKIMDVEIERATAYALYGKNTYSKAQPTKQIFSMESI